MRLLFRRFWLVAMISALAISTGAASATVVDLNTWTAESYAAVSGFDAGIWVVAPDGSVVQQTVNGQPTLFRSDFDAQNTNVQGKIKVTGSDDDFIGFALGFAPNDSTNGSADYLLVDWKRGTQSFDFGSPSSTPGTTALRGLAVSRVSGIPTADELWGHTDFASHTGGGLAELARGTTLGSTGWAINTEYDFQFVFLPNRLQVLVDGSLELDVSGAFSNGRMAFYNFSQAGVTYSAFTQDVATEPIVPEPSSLIVWSLVGLSFAGIGWRRRRRAA